MNTLVRPDPHLPLGGCEASGSGRDLGIHGMRELTNVKTVWVTR